MTVNSKREYCAMNPVPTPGLTCRTSYSEDSNTSGRGNFFGTTP